MNLIQFTIRFTTYFLLVFPFQSYAQNNFEGSESQQKTQSTEVLAQTLNQPWLPITILVDVPFAERRSASCYVIEIYTDYPHCEQLIYKGSIEADTFNSISLMVPFHTKSLHAQLKDGKIKVNKFISILSDSISISFASTALKSRYQPAFEYSIPSSPTLLNKSSSSTLKSKDTIVVHSTSSFKGEILVKGNTTFYVLGKVELTRLALKKGAALHIIIGPKGSLTVPHLSLTQNSSIVNYGNDITVLSSKLEVDYLFVNHGIIQLKRLTLQQGGMLKNHGTMRFETNVNCNASIMNYGKLFVKGFFNINTSGKVANHCRIEANQSIHQNGILNNHQYVKTDADFKTSEYSTTILTPGSILKMHTFNHQGKIIGPQNDYALIDVTHTTFLTATSSVVNNIDLNDLNGIEKKEGVLSSSLVYGTSFIPISKCSPGFGKQVTSDTDQDGIPDGIDDFPNNPLISFRWYTVPSAINNHLSPDYGIQIRSNSKNEIVDIVAPSP